MHCTSPDSSALRHRFRGSKKEFGPTLGAGGRLITFFSWSIMRISLPREFGRDPLDPGRDPGRDARDPGRDPAELLF